MDYKSITIQSYNKEAKEQSEKFKQLFDLKERPEFKEFLSLINGKEVLDIGCGSGEHALYFKNQSLNPTCIDLSEEMVKLSKQKGLYTIQMDFEELTFRENTFDGIWAVTSLFHIPKENLPPVLDKIYSILKPGGILFVSTKDGSFEGFKNNRYFAHITEQEIKQYYKKFTILSINHVQAFNRKFITAFFKKPLSP